MMRSLNKFEDEEDRHYYDFTDRYFELYYDNEDYFEEYSGGGVLPKYPPEQHIHNLNQQYMNVVKAGSKENNSKMEIEEQKQIDYQELEKRRIPPDEILDPFTMVNIDLLIAYSISQCKEIETKRKMANNILIIGGTCQFAKFIEELEDRLIENIQVYCPMIDRVEVFDCFQIKEILPVYLSWYGATVVPRVESMNDLWITRNRWVGSTLEEELNSDQREKSNEFGIKYLKEKIPFQW